MAMADLCTHFGTAPSTGGNKAKLVRAALGMRQFDHKWTLPSRLADSSLPWLITVDGLVVDARRLPMAIQRVAVAKGLIPYVNPSSGEDPAIPLIASATRAARHRISYVPIRRRPLGMRLLRVHPVRGRLGLAGRGENC